MCLHLDLRASIHPKTFSKITESHKGGFNDKLENIRKAIQEELEKVKVNKMRRLAEIFDGRLSIRNKQTFEILRSKINSKGQSKITQGITDQASFGLTALK